MGIFVISKINIYLVTLYISTRFQMATGQNVVFRIECGIYELQLNLWQFSKTGSSGRLRN